MKKDHIDPQPLSPNLERCSRWLSWALRHAPEEAGIELDKGGWANVSDLIKVTKVASRNIKPVELDEVVAKDAKKRFEYNTSKTKIRAAQGHSFPVDYTDKVAVPPAVLFHGTSTGVLDVIRASGLLRKSRYLVHLSKDEDTAAIVGKRHGQPVVLPVQAEAMHAQGYIFYEASNGVWLTEKVLPEFIDWNGLIWPSL